MEGQQPVSHGDRCITPAHPAPALALRCPSYSATLQVVGTSSPHYFRVGICEFTYLLEFICKPKYLRRFHGHSRRAQSSDKFVIQHTCAQLRSSKVILCLFVSPLILETRVLFLVYLEPHFLIFVLLAGDVAVWNGPQAESFLVSWVQESWMCLCVRYASFRRKLQAAGCEFSVRINNIHSCRNTEKQCIDWLTKHCDPRLTGT